MHKKHNLIFDVGMHKGEDTDYYLKKGFKVISFEADPELAAHCRNRFQSEIEQNQLTIVEGAIIDMKKHEEAPKNIRFFKNKKTSVWGTVVEEWANRNSQLGSDSEIIDVPVIDFGACLAEFGIPHYLKIDIEGMDVICLNALLEFDERPNYVSIESDKKSFERLKDEFELLEKLGYSSFQAVNQIKITSSKEHKNETEGKYLNYRFEQGSSGPFGSDLNAKPWKSKKDIIKQYEKIFKAYKYFGDDSKLNKIKIGNKICKALNYFLGYPGWYDTHARHRSIVE